MLVDEWIPGTDPMQEQLEHICSYMAHMTKKSDYDSFVTIEYMFYILVNCDFILLLPPCRHDDPGGLELQHGAQPRCGSLLHSCSDL